MDETSTPTPLTPVEQAELRLTERELKAYRAWKGMGQPRLSPDTQAKFFALFLKGESLEDIVRINRGFSIGQLAQARVEGLWDEKRDEYLKDLFDSARAIVKQSTIESMRFLIDQLGAVHKKYGEAARKYIQNGDDTEFKNFGIDNIRNYKTAVEALQKLTGADKKVVEHHHEHNHQDASAPVAPAHRPLTRGEASNVIRLASAAKGGRK